MAAMALPHRLDVDRVRPPPHCCSRVTWVLFNCKKRGTVALARTYWFTHRNKWIGVSQYIDRADMLHGLVVAANIL